MSRPNKKKNSKKKRRASGTGTPTVSDVSSPGAQASGEGGDAAGTSKVSPSPSNNAASPLVKGEQPGGGPVAAKEEPKPSPQKAPGPSQPKEQGAPIPSPVKKEAALSEAPAGSRQSGGHPVQSSAVKKTTIDGSAPTATAATSDVAAPGGAAKDATSQTCVCSLQ